MEELIKIYEDMGPDPGDASDAELKQLQLAEAERKTTQTAAAVPLAEVVLPQTVEVSAAA